MNKTTEKLGFYICHTCDTQTHAWQLTRCPKCKCDTVEHQYNVQVDINNIELTVLADILAEQGY